MHFETRTSKFVGKLAVISSFFYLFGRMVIRKYQRIFGGRICQARGLDLPFKLFHLLGGIVIRKYHCIPHNLPHFVCRDLHWEGKSDLKGEG